MPRITSLIESATSVAELTQARELALSGKQGTTWTPQMFDAKVATLNPKLAKRLAPTAGAVTGARAVTVLRPKAQADSLERAFMAAEASSEVGAEPVAAKPRKERKVHRAVRTFVDFKAPQEIILLRDDDKKRYRSVWTREETSVYLGVSRSFIHGTIGGVAVRISGAQYERLGAAGVEGTKLGIVVHANGKYAGTFRNAR